MKRSLKWAVIVGAIALTGAGFIGGRAWAGGIPSAGALTYSGLLQDASGAPLSGTEYVEVKFWNDATASAASNLLCDTGTPSGIGLVEGRFSIALPDKCATQVGSNAGIWAEVIVGQTASTGATLGRAKLGAVPYAIEANHAVSADSAATAASASGALATTISSLAPASSLPNVTAWADFAGASMPLPVTPAGPITNGSNVARWRRVGDSVEMWIVSAFPAGPPNVTGQMLWNLPAGFLANLADNSRMIGTAYVWSGGLTLAQVCEIFVSGGGTKNQAYGYCTGAGGPLTTTSPASSLVEVDLHLSYPVQGWSVTP